MTHPIANAQMALYVFGLPICILGALFGISILAGRFLRNRFSKGAR